MADYIYLLENRLSGAQRAALLSIREVARSRGLTIFLVGGAVRDLTSGSPVRDLDVVVQGNASKLKKELEKAGFEITGELDSAQTVFARSSDGARLEIGSTLSVTYPKPGKPVAKAASILEDLRRRDFTANAMALSLNEGSYGLLMDPLNGVADIENRELRLVSNYGFIEDPVRMIRAARFSARLGWQMEEKTLARYEAGKQEGYISAMQAFHRGYETEEIVHEEDPLRVMRRLEAEGWMKHLAPAWGTAKANVPELERLRETQTQLQMQGLQPDGAAASFPLLTAKMNAKEIETLKASFPRQGFVGEIEALEAEGKEFAALLGGKAGATPSQAWKLLHSSRPEAVLWAAFTSKSAPVQARLKSFSTEWPQARQGMPYLLLQEMRITPDLPGYDELLEKLFFELMDGHLGTPEEMKAYLEPFSPPAPPPPVHLRRPRAAKKESKSAAKSREKREAAAAEEELAEDGGETQSSAAAPGEGPVAPDLTPAGVAEGSEPAPVAQPSRIVEEKKAAPAKAPAKVEAKGEAAKPVAETEKSAAGKPDGGTVAKKVAEKVVASVAAKKVAGKDASGKETSGKDASAKETSGKEIAGGAKAPATPAKKAGSKMVTAAAVAKKVASKPPAAKGVKADAGKASAKKAPAKTAAPAAKTPAKKSVAKTAGKKR